MAITSRIMAPSPGMRPLMGAAAVAIAVWNIASARAEAPRDAIDFVPHRAVYDITLDRSGAGAGVSDMTGRMVYELTGSRCEGWTQNMRFVTRMVNQDGGTQLNDLVTSSWEEQGGKRLRFNQTQSKDNQPEEISQGDARRSADGKSTVVEMVKPARKKMTYGGDVLFPIQHSMALVAAARAGRSSMTADLFDGSEKGEKVYQTTAVIGRKIVPGAVKSPAALDEGPDHKLAGITSWPVSISYFEPGSAKTDAVPSYEIAFRFYENGVSSRLHIDYGDFAINGALSALTYIEPTKCEGDAK